MTSAHTLEVAKRAQALYERRLRAGLEATNRNDFAAIEPESGDYFVAETLREAIRTAREVHPMQLPCAFRVGHETAVQFGMLLQ